MAWVRSNSTPHRTRVEQCASANCRSRAPVGVDVGPHEYRAVLCRARMKQVTVASVCFGIFLAHVALAVHSCDWLWVSRSGTSIVAVGLLMESWNLLTTPKHDEMLVWSTPEGHSALRASVVIIIVGTLVQGYADLPFASLARCG